MSAPCERRVKGVVFDLDGTVWDGVLLEGDVLSLRPEVPRVIRTLDERGILCSIASRNDHDLAMAELHRLGLEEYFLYPQIHFGSKVESLRAVARELNLGLDAFAFVDDQEHELAEVRHSLPEVLCVAARDLAGLVDLEATKPGRVTLEARQRRQLYRADGARKRAQEQYTGPSQEFLATLAMRFTIGAAAEADLARAEELTVRTHQLNATGVTYDEAQLRALAGDPGHKLWVGSLQDRFGSYGTIALTLIECRPELWTLKLLLASCRVMAHGVGGVLLNHVMRRAREAGVRLQAHFVDTGKNRMMLVTYSFAGLCEVERQGSLTILEADLAHVQPPPAYMELELRGGV